MGLRGRRPKKGKFGIGRAGLKLARILECN